MNRIFGYRSCYGCRTGNCQTKFRFRLTHLLTLRTNSLRKDINTSLFSSTNSKIKEQTGNSLALDGN